MWKVALLFVKKYNQKKNLREQLFLQSHLQTSVAIYNW